MLRLQSKSMAERAAKPRFVSAPLGRSANDDRKDPFKVVSFNLQNHTRFRTIEDTGIDQHTSLVSSFMDTGSIILLQEASAWFAYLEQPLMKRAISAGYTVHYSQDAFKTIEPKDKASAAHGKFGSLALIPPRFRIVDSKTVTPFCFKRVTAKQQKEVTELEEMVCEAMAKVEMCRTTSPPQEREKAMEPFKDAAKAAQLELKNYENGIPPTKESQRKIVFFILFDTLLCSEMVLCHADIPHCHDTPQVQLENIFDFKEAVAEFMDTQPPHRTNLIVAGDFDCFPGSDAYEILTGKFKTGYPKIDAPWRSVFFQSLTENYATAYVPKKDAVGDAPETPAKILDLDHIFVVGKTPMAKQTEKPTVETMDRLYHGRWPAADAPWSTHHPISADFVFERPERK